MVATLSVSEQSARKRAAIGLAAIAVLTVALYAPNFERQFVFDSIAAIQLNPALAEVDVGRFLVDPNALTVIRENADYRPLLLLVNALNYKLSGTDTWSWHLVQVAIHLGCVGGLFVLMLRLQASWMPTASAASRTHVALVAGLLFAVHPTAVGVVNYDHARSSMLVALLLLPACTAYLRAVTPAIDDASSARWRSGVLAWVLYVLALLTKAEAIAAIAVFVLFDLIARDRAAPSLPGLLRGLASRGAWLRLAPFVVAAVAYVAIRHVVLPHYVEPARHDAGVDWYAYLSTQTTVWWTYIGKWLWPLRLVADDLTYPIHRSLLEVRPLAAALGWLAALALALWRYRRSPWPLVGIGSYLILLSPTSSVLPLAEMLNEHRPYLPLGLLVSCGLVEAAGGLSWLAARMQMATSSPRTRLGLQAARWLPGAVLAVLVGLLVVQSVQRMPVFRTRLAYYQNIVDVAPSARALLNLGLELAIDGRTDDAMGYYRAALQRAPRWYLAHLNLARVYAQRGDVRAVSHFDEAVRFER